MSDKLTEKLTDMVDNPYHYSGNSIAALARAALELRNTAHEFAQMVSDYDRLVEIDARLAKALGVEQ